MGDLFQYVLMTLLFVTALFLVLLVLVQRGRGGGLAGAFGGAGGQSAFGTKAGDVFTRITIGTATVWILLCAFSVKYLGSNDERIAHGSGKPAANAVAPADAGSKTGSSKTEGGKTGSGKNEGGKTGEKPSDKAPPAGEADVSAAPPAQPESQPATQEPVVTLPPGSLTPNGSVAPQTPIEPPANK